MTLKSWREIAIPHEDVLHGTFQQSEFAADISRVHQGTATAEYQDPVLFFQRTFITEGMRLLLDSVVKRLAGKGGDPVVQLQTAFGGGKTHTLLSVYHLAKGTVPTSQLQGIPPILDAAHISELPKARVVVLDGVDLLDLANKPRKRGETVIKTIWGELAWQLGGDEAFSMVKEADESGTAPGKGVLSDLLNQHAPAIILIDELVRYVSQFEDGKALTGGTYDTQLSFIQALTEALKAVPNSILLASLPYSDREAVSHQGVKALKTLEHYFGRVQALWKPVATEEAFEIVRRRLFSSIKDTVAADQVCRAFADYYIANSGDFPSETQGSNYFERLRHAYPIHPEVFDRLYEDWSSLENFQRTRGVLKLMAQVIHRLWESGNNDLMIQPGSLPLSDPDTQNEAVYYLAQGWNPVLDKDIDGNVAATTELDNTRPLFGSIHACRRVARSIFLGSAPDAGIIGGAKHHQGLELERVLLGSAQPGQVVGHYKDAVRALVDRLQYLNAANNRYWFDTRPNLRREMEQRKRRFDLKEHVNPFIKEKLKTSNGVFDGVHIFTQSGDIPDDWHLRLVILPPNATFSRSSQNSAVEAAEEILRKRGDQPRLRQNRLIFLAADNDSLGRLNDQVTSVLAWRSIVSDVTEGRLNLDQHQSKQALNSLDLANESLARMVRETYKWLLVPMQEARTDRSISELQWEHHIVNPAAVNRTDEIGKILREHELLISEWAPVHLAKMLSAWFWKDLPGVGAVDVWQKTCCYLYLPRLRDSETFRAAINAGVASRDFFGIAYGQDNDRYLGFHFGERTIAIFDETLLLIQPAVAADYAVKLTEEAIVSDVEQNSKNTKEGDLGDQASTDNVSSTTARSNAADSRSGAATASTGASIKKTTFFASVELDPVKAKLQFSDIAEEVLMLFTQKAGVKVRVSVEIEAEAAGGFDDSTQRAVTENCDQLKIVKRSFD